MGGCFKAGRQAARQAAVALPARTCPAGRWAAPTYSAPLARAVAAAARVEAKDHVISCSAGWARRRAP